MPDIRSPLKNIFGEILVTCSPFLISSCNLWDNDKWPDSVAHIQSMFDAFDKEIEIKGEIFLEDSVHLLRPFRFKIIGDYLIVNDKDGTFFFSVYDFKTKKHLCRF